MSKHRQECLAASTAAARAASTVADTFFYIPRREREREERERGRSALEEYRDPVAAKERLDAALRKATKAEERAAAARAAALLDAQNERDGPAEEEGRLAAAWRAVVWAADALACAAGHRAEVEKIIYAERMKDIELNGPTGCN